MGWTRVTTGRSPAFHRLSSRLSHAGDRAHTAATLQKARAIAIRNGLLHVYVGNVHDPAWQATLCRMRRARDRARRLYHHDLRARRFGRLRTLGPGWRAYSRRSPARGARGGCPSTSDATQPEDIRVVCSLEFLKVTGYPAPQWAKAYTGAVAKALGDAYAEPAKDVEGYIAYVKGREDLPRPAATAAAASTALLM